MKQSFLTLCSGRVNDPKKLGIFIGARLFRSAILYLIATAEFPFAVAFNFIHSLATLKPGLLSIMATQCAASAKLALPSLLRSVFRSEFSRDLRPNILRSSRPSLQLQHRAFSSTPRAFQIQINQSPDLITTSAPHQTSQSTTPPSTSSPSATEETTAPESPRKHASDRTKKRAKKEKTIRDDSKPQNNDRKRFSKVSKPDSAKKAPMKKEKPDPWRTQKDALDKKFPNGWNPPKKLSPDALEGIRHLHATAPDRFTTSVLAEEFKVSPEAIRRILKSRWRPSEAEAEDRRKRWEKRHERIWSRMAELGLRPSTKASRPYSDANSLYKPGDREF
ncbi:Required for respiratory growth protein 9, mitochondrial [Penicillium brasilianum]|uniref:Required for respiratory growth protein 9, mitochondrial n=1 Tax=Penicillium brasilianum TaxID=104259 RepID=A0A1S9RRI4_PENBI|nr:Required for respiratory growth protein 9, mitochondrial [Penicillium brasilianum]